MYKGLIATFMVALMLITVLSGVVTVNALSTSEDITPPITWHILNPLEPNGENGWYIYVEITICAEDLESGVKVIRVSINGGSWQTFPGHDCITFIIDDDGDDILIYYTATDNAGNEAPIKSFTINFDATVPDMDINYEVVDGVPWWQGWELVFTATAADASSGMDRIEMYIDDELYEISTGLGPTYEFIINWSSELKTAMFNFMFFDIAGNSDIILINGSDIKSGTRSQRITSYSGNLWLQRFFDRFPLFNLLLQRLRI